MANSSLGPTAGGQRGTLYPIPWGSGYWQRPNEKGEEGLDGGGRLFLLPLTHTPHRSVTFQGEGWGLFSDSGHISEGFFFSLLTCVAPD